MAKNVAKVLGQISAIQTLIENFPMSILSMMQGKHYTSVIEFVLDVLRMVGLSETDILDELILTLFNVPNAVELYNGLNGFKYKKIKQPTEGQKIQAVIVENIPDCDLESPLYIAKEIGLDELEHPIYEYYQKKAKFESEETSSDFITNLEDSLKAIIVNMFTGILSCSVIPEIRDRYMDFNGGISIPVSALDTFNLLDLSPTNEIGKNFYNVEDDLSSADLYSSYDLNAFIWYVLNRGSRVPQTEYNKMMWDSRLGARKDGTEERKDASDWNAWYSSKTNGNPFLSLKGKDGEYEAAYEDGTTISMPVHPILQFERETVLLDEKRIRVKFPAQTYFVEDDFNKSIYLFNADYLRNIKILSSKVIIANMLDDFLNGNIVGSLGISYSPKIKIIERKIEEYLKNAMEADDAVSTDCFFSFSNEVLDAMLKEMELQRYGAVGTDSTLRPAIAIDPNMGIDAMNEINSMATSNEKIETIKKTLYDIATIPSTETVTTVGGWSINSDWIIRLIMALIRPIIRALFSPQIMLLFLIDFEVMGLIKLEGMTLQEIIDELIFKKLMSVLISLVQYIKDKIVEFLMELFYRYFEPMLIAFNAVILLEQLNDWIILLEEAIACLPTFDFSRNRVAGQIDDVNYADIVKTQDIPEKDKSC